MRVFAVIVVFALVMTLAALEVFASRALAELEVSGSHASDLWRPR
jgi:hypothetical protein